MLRTVLFNNRITFSQICAAGMVPLIIFSASHWEQHIVGDLFFLMGTVLVGIATMGRIWCSFYISGYKNNTLIMTGPYSISRNPLYLFSLLGSIGVGLATETITIPFIIIVVFALYYPYIIREEEKGLMHIHGSRFKEYCEQTPRFFPTMKSINEPDSYEIKPKILRRRLFDSLWFIWVLGILELLEGLHDYQWIAVYIRLY